MLNKIKLPVRSLLNQAVNISTIVSLTTKGSPAWTSRAKNGKERGPSSATRVLPVPGSTTVPGVLLLLLATTSRR